MWTREVPSTSTTSAVSPEVRGAPQPLQGPSGGAPDSLVTCPSASESHPGGPLRSFCSGWPSPFQLTGQLQVEAPVCGGSVALATDHQSPHPSLKAGWCRGRGIPVLRLPSPCRGQQAQRQQQEGVRSGLGKPSQGLAQGLRGVLTGSPPCPSEEPRLRGRSVREAGRLLRHLPAGQQSQGADLPLPLRLQPGQRREVVQE